MHVTHTLLFLCCYYLIISSDLRDICHSILLSILKRTLLLISSPIAPVCAIIVMHDVYIVRLKN